MALIKCSDCKEKISKKAKVCPKCGAPIKKKTSLLTWLITLILVLFVFTMVTSKNSTPIQTKPKIKKELTKVAPVERSSLQVERDKVQKLFKSKEEPATKDALWTSDFIFKVGVINDGTPRDGYASYVCQVLYEYGFKGKKVWVQVIDIAKLTRTNKWVKLGESHCQ